MVLDFATSPYPHLNVEEFATSKQAVKKYMVFQHATPPVPISMLIFFMGLSGMSPFNIACGGEGEGGSARVIVSDEYPSTPNFNIVLGGPGGEMLLGSSAPSFHRHPVSYMMSRLSSQHRLLYIKSCVLWSEATVLRRSR